MLTLEEIERRSDLRFRFLLKVLFVLHGYDALNADLRAAMAADALDIE